MSQRPLFASTTHKKRVILAILAFICGVKTRMVKIYLELGISLLARILSAKFLKLQLMELLKTSHFPLLLLLKKIGIKTVAIVLLKTVQVVLLKLG